MKKQQQNICPKKRFGQNFLRDASVLDRIVQTIHPVATDFIIEVGLGEGVLTKKILEGGSRVLGIEIDNDLIPNLQHRFGSNARFCLHHGDILDFSLAIMGSIVNNPLMLADVRNPHFVYKLVGNIPYNLTTKLFERVLLWESVPDSITFMIQKEVGEKIVKKGGKNSPLATCVEMLGEATIAFPVPPTAFYPIPNVDSVVIHVDGSKSKKVTNAYNFYDFTHKVFRMPRKTLLNNLYGFLDKEKVRNLLASLTLDPMRRPENLRFEELKKLWEGARKDGLPMIQE